MQVEFSVDVSIEDALRFGDLSGDKNPLHTDPSYAATTVYGRPVLFGAYAAGLFSRVAGMHIPGEPSLLRGMILRFHSPILLPASLVVKAQLESSSDDGGEVSVQIIDSESKRKFVSGTYGYSYHETRRESKTPVEHNSGSIASLAEESRVLITGASGGIGQALAARLGSTAITVSRSGTPDLKVNTYGDIAHKYTGEPLRAIVHCAYPNPDSQSFIDLDDPESSIRYYVSDPLLEIQFLANLLRSHGEENASLILIGSTYSRPGRHAYRHPLYSLGKSMIPSLASLLALELAGDEKNAIAVEFDNIDGGMNMGMNARLRMANAARYPRGKMPSPEDAAAQIMWILSNRTALTSGATIALSGGSLP